MAKITVVTGFSSAGYCLYGRRFIETFRKFVPEDIGLIAYVAEPIDMPRGRYVLHSQLSGVNEFVERNKNIPEHCGARAVHNWRKKDVKAGYSYRHDAVKFCWQLCYPNHAANSMRDDEILTWFDGDVVFTDNMSTSVIDSGMVNADLIYLGRRTHTELGFWSIKLNARTRQFLHKMADMYTSEDVFKLPEWHSAYVFDHCRGLFRDIPTKDLTPNDAGDVWHRSPLRRFSVHLKGKLKGTPC